MHIDTLKDIVSAKSQERVGEGNLKEKSETTADVKRTDIKNTCNETQPQRKRVTYAEALMNSDRRKQGNNKQECEAANMLTLKK
jgi:hypothetical protein